MLEVVCFILEKHQEREKIAVYYLSVLEICKILYAFFVFEIPTINHIIVKNILFINCILGLKPVLCINKEKSTCKL